MEVERSTTALTGLADSAIDNGLESVTCPKCRTKITLTQALKSEFEERSRARVEAELERREAVFRAEAAKTLAATRAEAEARTKEELSTRMADLEAQVREKSTRIEEATKIELALRSQQRAIEERENSLRLEVARQVDAERRKAEEQTAERISEEYRIREAQMKEQLASMSRTIEDLKRKAEQGSQQLQGEAVEVEFESVLKETFPMDEVAPVAKGVRGADIVHTVRTVTGTNCAAIVWETKNAKAWSPKWLQKIREDQREAKADVAVIVTNVLPAGVHSFGQVEGVWVCDLPSAPALAIALRCQLQAVQRERVASQGRATKEAHLYDYVTGIEFRQQVVAALTTLSQMQKDLNRERASAARSFAKRDKQILAAFGSIAEVYGGAQGIIGASLAPVALLESAEDDEADDDAPAPPDLIAS